MIVPESITTRYQLGQFGEDYVMRDLRRAGLNPVRLEKGNGGDLQIGSLRIEVKTAAENFDGKYRFCLTKDDKHGKTEHEKSDIVVLVCCAASGLISTFVVPVEALANKTDISLPKLRGYRGKYAEYRKSLMRGLRRWIH